MNKQNDGGELAQETMSTTPEQQARNMLERMDVDYAQDMTAGDVIELANLIRELAAANKRVGEAYRAGQELMREQVLRVVHAYGVGYPVREAIKDLELKNE